VEEVPLRRTQCSWAELRSPSGLEAELAGAISAGGKTLLILPQAWMLDTLWPLWALLAPWLFRYDAAMPAGELTHILHAIVAGGCIAGTEAAWRLALYVPFEQVILVDPSHPQWQPEAAPWLDSRSALLLGCASAGARLSLIEMGLSAFDSKLRFSVDIFPPHNPAESGAAEGTQAADINPLPLKLREPDRRRLVYFNRLGASRGLTCAECASSVNCPQCRSRGIHFSQQSQSYLCPTCGLEERSLRCPRCGLANLAAHLPGLEAVRVRPGELVVTSASGALPGPESGVVLGTARLLEPVPGYWPEQVVYVDPEERDLLDSDWRSALDQALRLGSLYANPGLATICIVSARLAERLKQPLASAEATDAAQQESQLRKLAGLAPWGCLYRLRLLAGSLPPLQTARELLGQVLSAHPATSLLRIGRPFVRMKRCELHGYLLNPALSWPELQELRWQTLPLQVTLSFHAERGPWL
jgi:hypothetical protein